MDLPERKPMRLRDYDYSSPGAYFITICTREKRCILSSIQKPSAGGVGDGAPAVPRVRLTSVGQIVDKTITDAQAHYGWLSVDRYVIMPNHVHLLITVKAGGTPMAPAPTCPPGGENDERRAIRESPLRRWGGFHRLM